jgi:hypothetical protein
MNRFILYILLVFSLPVCAQYTDIEYNGWGKLRIDSTLNDYYSDSYWIESSVVSKRLLDIYEKDSGYTMLPIDQGACLTVKSPDYTSYLGVESEKTQIFIDSTYKINSVTVYFNSDKAALLATKLANRFKVPAPVALGGKPGSYNKTYTNGEYKIQFFSETKINNIQLRQVCLIRHWKNNAQSLSSELKALRKLIVHEVKKKESAFGIGAIKLGVKRSSIQKYLKPGKFVNYSDQQAAKAEGIPASEFGEPSCYRVNTQLAPYTSYAGVPIKLIELYFSENDVLVDILVIFEDTKLNQAKLREALELKWGTPEGALGYDENNKPNGDFYLIWEQAEASVTLMNFDNKGFPNPDKVIYLHFFKDSF